MNVLTNILIDIQIPEAIYNQIIDTIHTGLIVTAVIIFILAFVVRLSEADVRSSAEKMNAYYVENMTKIEEETDDLERQYKRELSTLQMEFAYLRKQNLYK